MDDRPIFKDMADDVYKSDPRPEEEDDLEVIPPFPLPYPNSDNNYFM